MMRPSRKRTAMLALAVAALGGAVVLGVVTRLGDPLSSSVVPAEDPYTHMILVREHLRDGELEPLNAGGSLYPPGLHAFLAAAWSYTGVDLHPLFLFGPVVFGAIGILGVMLLLLRSDGVVAAFVGALALALAPEMVFRTTMMSPTALDMAILPFFLYALLRTMRGGYGWAGITGVLALFFLLAHPWLLAILGPVTVGAVVLSILFPWNTRSGARMMATGSAAVLVAMGLGLGIAVGICSTQCGLGFDDLELTGGHTVEDIGLAFAATSVALGVLLWFLRGPVDRAQERILERRPPSWLRALASLAILGVVAAITMPAARTGMPDYVDLPRMFGWPMLALGALGLAALPFASSRAAVAGAAVVAVTYPFVVHNPFHSEFWPHRTAAYFGIGLVVLAGVGAGILVRLGTRASHALAHRRRRRTSAGHPVVAGTAATLLLAIGLGGTVYAATPLEYEDGWYRLYPECEFDALRQIGDGSGYDTVVITGSWQAKLVAAAFADEADNVWYDYSFFTDPERRADVIGGMSSQGKDVVVVVDRHLLLEHRDVDTGFLHDEPFAPHGSWCEGQGIAGARLSAYSTGGTA